MAQTIELHLEERVLARARRLAQARHCRVEDIFEDAIQRMPVVEAPISAVPADPFLGMFKDDPDLIDQVTQSAMAARGRHPLRSDSG